MERSNSSSLGCWNSRLQSPNARVCLRDSIFRRRARPKVDRGSRFRVGSCKFRGCCCSVHQQLGPVKSFSCVFLGISPEGTSNPVSRAAFWSVFDNFFRVCTVPHDRSSCSIGEVSCADPDGHGRLHGESVLCMWEMYRLSRELICSFTCMSRRPLRDLFCF